MLGSDPGLPSRVTQGARSELDRHEEAGVLAMGRGASALLCYLLDGHELLLVVRLELLHRIGSNLSSVGRLAGG